MNNKKYLVVSVHDATPRFKGELQEIVSELDRIGIKRKSILVIPNYYGEESILDNKDFIFWLHSLKSNGDELVQHGYNHVSTNHNFSSRFQKILGTKVNHGEAEFQNISYWEAKAKIGLGRKMLNQAGIYPKGFVAPAWLLNPESERAIKDSEFSYATKFRKIEFYSQEKTEKSEAIVFTSGKGFVNKLFALYNHDLVHRVFKKRRVARIALHPMDMHWKYFESLLNSIEKVKQGREITTYADLASNI